MALLERHEELATIAAAVADAAAGRGRFLVVSGEAGIGKTALVHEAVRRLDDDVRVLRGACDDLRTPRPLGPVRDVAEHVGGPLRAALEAGELHEVYTAALAELHRPGPPTVLVVEDLHWADDATLDLLAVLGRRVSEMRAVIVTTLRTGEAGPDHRVHATLAGLAADDVVHLVLGPLTRAAVAELAAAADADPERVWALTRGNPFYVSELLGGRDGEVPPSVASAVLGRAARLTGPSRRLVELVCVIPSQVPVAVLDAALPGWAGAAEGPERSGLLEVTPSRVGFRHELARAALRSSLPVARRRLLHAQVLAVLLAIGADPAEIVHHAEEAGDLDVVASYALTAARRAAALESSREAYAHFRRAADLGGRLPLLERAALAEDLAAAAYTVDRPAEALDRAAEAVTLYRRAGDLEAVGRCTRTMSRYHWYAGDGAAADALAREAVAVLEPLGQTRELARAYSALSQLAMLSHRSAEAVELGQRALDLATRLGDDAIRAHALVNIGNVRLELDPDDTATSEEAVATARAAGDAHEAVRGLIGLGYSLLAWARPGPALRYTRQAVAHAQEHQVDVLASYALAMEAWLLLRAGSWGDAERLARREVSVGSGVGTIVATTVLAELAVRRGDDDAAERLAELGALASRTRELQRLGPVLELEIERMLTSGAAVPAERVREVAALLRTVGTASWTGERAAAWAGVAGVALDVATDAVHQPFAAMVGHRWREAAHAFGAVGWGYDEALMLTLGDDPDGLRAALETARRLGAAPLARRAAERLRGLGHPVTRGLGAPTRASPAGLTARQAEVADLVAAGLSNADIARRLVLSERTVEHHVAAVLAKLGARRRGDVAQLLLDGAPTPG